MIHLFGANIQLPFGGELLDSPLGAFVATLAAWLAIALALYLIATYPLRWLTRHLPGEIEDIILELFRRPVTIIALSFGALDSLEILPLRAEARQILERLFVTILILVVVYTLWWVVKDVLVYYGSRWARTSESSLDDILIPALNLFGPLLLLVIGAALIFPVWGIDLSSVLFGAGVVGLVLGLALQEPLSNVFSGLSLLIESPFRPGDLILFSGDRIGEVERLGLRSTQIYSVDDHSTVYLPNKALSANMIMNVSKPTVEQKYSITLAITPEQDMVRIQEEVVEIANAHPNVVTDDLKHKIALLHGRIASNEQRAQALAENNLARRKLLDEANKYKQAAYRLELENLLNHYLSQFQNALVSLVPAIRQREDGGFTKNELRGLHQEFVTPAQEALELTIAQAERWSQAPDPWITDREQRQLNRLWRERNERLQIRWQNLHQDLTRPRGRAELRLDDLTIEMLEWLKRDYKVLPEEWKNPAVTFKEFDGTNTKVQLWFFVDNVRLEHYERPRRVMTELARQIRENLGAGVVPYDK